MRPPTHAVNAMATSTINTWPIIRVRECVIIDRLLHTHICHIKVASILCTGGALLLLLLLVRRLRLVGDALTVGRLVDTG